jgi:predicted DsbA family dithiol-disulfide isomerase
LKIELFHSPGCTRCDAGRAELRAAAEAVVPGIEWHEVNVLDSFERAVELGVLTLPALAIDGKLVFTTLPSVAQFTDALRQRRAGHGDGA